MSNFIEVHTVEIPAVIGYKHRVGQYILFNGIWLEVTGVTETTIFVRRIELTIRERLRSLYYRVVERVQAIIHSYS